MLRLITAIMITLLAPAGVYLVIKGIEFGSPAGFIVGAIAVMVSLGVFYLLARSLGRDVEMGTFPSVPHALVLVASGVVVGCGLWVCFWVSQVSAEIPIRGEPLGPDSTTAEIWGFVLGLSILTTVFFHWAARNIEQCKKEFGRA